MTIETKKQTEFESVENLKAQWKKLWFERLDDPIRAEKIATDTFPSLFIEKGTILHATRDFKILSLKEILTKHEIANAERYIPPDPRTGGWTKFYKVHIKNKSESKTNVLANKKSQKQQPKNKKSRGWLHRQIT